MRRRQSFRRRVHAFLGSFCVASGLVFLFEDNLAYRPHLTPLAQAGSTVAEIFEETAQPLKRHTLQETMNASVPSGFQASWKEQNLDGGQIRLKLLKTPFAMGQTEYGLGGEYFAYAAGLFHQIADQVQSPALGDNLRMLTTQAQGLGNTVREAGSLRFEGKPSPDLKHLQVRENLRVLAQSLGGASMLTATYDEKGRLLEQKQLLLATSGESLEAFLEKSRAILQSKEARQYPETMRVIRSQSEWLERVAKSVAVRWDDTRYCPGACTAHSVHLKVYAQQQLPAYARPELLTASR